jgi:hypothetical protein
VVYFHYPRFSRKPHFELKKIPSAALHMLPLITQLLPDIPVVYDDDSFVPGLMDGRLASSKAAALAKAPWAWLVCCGTSAIFDLARSIRLTRPCCRRFFFDTCR